MSYMSSDMRTPEEYYRTETKQEEEEREQRELFDAEDKIYKYLPDLDQDAKERVNRMLEEEDDPRSILEFIYKIQGEE